MVGIETSREPIRGAMAQQMREHMAQRATLRSAGKIQQMHPVRKSKVVIRETANA